MIVKVHHFEFEPKARRSPLPEESPHQGPAGLTGRSDKQHRHLRSRRSPTAPPQSELPLPPESRSQPESQTSQACHAHHSADSLRYQPRLEQHSEVPQSRPPEPPNYSKSPSQKLDPNHRMEPYHERLEILRSNDLLPKHARHFPRMSPALKPANAPCHQQQRAMENHHHNPPPAQSRRKVFSIGYDHRHSEDSPTTGPKLPWLRVRSPHHAAPLPRPKIPTPAPKFHPEKYNLPRRSTSIPKYPPPKAAS